MGRRRVFRRLGLLVATVLSAGVRHLVANPPLRQVTVAAVCAVLGFGFSETTIFAVVDEGLHRASAFVGVLVTLRGSGAARTRRPTR